MTEYRVTWARLRDQSRPKKIRRAHLIPVPISDHRMAACGAGLDAREWVTQEADDATPRCGRCEEAERNHLSGKVV